MKENVQFCEFLLLKIVNFWVSLSTGILNISFLKLVWKKINLGQHCTASHLIDSQWDSKLKNIWHLGQSLFYMIKRIKSMNLVLNLRKKKTPTIPLTHCLQENMGSSGRMDLPLGPFSGVPRAVHLPCCMIKDL